MANGITLSEKNVKIDIDGMFCVNCQHKIEKVLGNTEGIHKIEVSYRKGNADIIFDENIITLNEVAAIIEKMGYTINLERNQKDTDIVNTSSLHCHVRGYQSFPKSFRFEKKERKPQK